jgi:hypothetical protein
MAPHSGTVLCEACPCGSVLPCIRVFGTAKVIAVAPVNVPSPLVLPMPNTFPSGRFQVPLIVSLAPNP